MADTITIPGAGPVKKEYAVLGAAGLAAFLGVAYYRKRATAPVTDPYAGVDPNAVTPSSDYTSPGSNSNIPPQDSTGTTTNAEWAQKATIHLGNIGYDPKVVAGGIGQFFQRRGLDPQQFDAVTAAVGQFGPPPQNGPWPITRATEATGGGPLTAPHNVHQTNASQTTVTLAWDAVPGATQYTIQQGGMAGQWHADWDTSPTNSYTVSGLRPNTSYVLLVTAQKAGAGGTVDNSPSVAVTGRTSP